MLHRISYVPVYQRHLKYSQSMLFKGEWPVDYRESQTTKLLGVASAMDASKSHFTQVMGNQFVFNMPIALEISPFSIVLVTVCACVYQTYK
jgi:hypothetical protein